MKLENWKTAELSIERLKNALDKNEKPSSQDESELHRVMEGLNRGELRVASKQGDTWTTHAWIKQAVLLYMRLTKSAPIPSGAFQYFDKIPVKKFSEQDQVRSVPMSFVRYGAFVAPNAILMPSFVNIGAYVGSNTMVDGWATVGSCAQIGEGVHLSGGVGIGGVLEPVQASPVIVEENAFIGSRCIVVEGVHIEKGAVLGAGVTLTKSTRIIDVTGEQEVVLKGRIPAWSVVIPGVFQKTFTSGSYGVPCALIIGKRSANTDEKTSLNSALREFNVSV